MIENFVAELALTMALLGIRAIEDLSGDLLVPAPDDSASHRPWLARTVDAIAQMCDIGSIEHSNPAELPAALEAVEQADSIAHQDWHHMQLQFID